ncbi:MAG TPA: 3'-5' exonuclease [Pyrinomonadaceae bacterium]
MVKRALIIDTETNGLDDTAQVIEVGAILYSVENQCTLQEISTLLPALKNEAESINRIKATALGEIELTRSVSFAQELLFAMSKAADVFVAHNAEFDSKKLLGDTRFPLASLPWLCTMSDFKWPLATREQGSLINLALDHGIGVASAHRALTDCRLIAALFDRMSDLPAMFTVAMRPKALFVGLQPFDDNQLAKDAGFKWDRLVPRKWSRMMAIEDATALSFPVRRVEQ